MAAKDGHDKIVKLLLKDKRVNPAANENYAIQYAAANGHDKVVKLLLQDARVNPAADGNYAINIAARNGHDKVVELLLKDKHIDPSHAISNAVSDCHYKVTKLLLKDKRLNLFVGDNRPVYLVVMASINDDDKMLDLLLKDTRFHMEDVVDAVNYILPLQRVILRAFKPRINSHLRNINKLKKNKDLQGLSMEIIRHKKLIKAKNDFLKLYPGLVDRKVLEKQALDKGFWGHKTEEERGDKKKRRSAKDVTKLLVQKYLGGGNTGNTDFFYQ